ncbi:membrane protein insertion efficiency factor YidD [Candidatus Azambacteria bacterium RIFCSPHIGHO2_02_46_12]|uniref:Putative membrane protein insertion efficiency factor n=1 Tax=Candidatus Azambacteria bacterium RIFCSPHIGHO2_02_46_12 TaxID=1797295 RepID=A0A1F5BH59_9BACT|nr:MAG: membrane protein insertion efficiency factor YidD [Candidatus Azambacteria bacterium RIFCSPHIGHO2_02_46_12]
MTKLILKTIRIYQKIFSLDHGPLRGIFYFFGCRFYPTCSEYGYQAIEKHGLKKGAAKSILRILKCNPFYKGGIDPVGN